jgi:hypothetical protein
MLDNTVMFCYVNKLIMHGVPQHMDRHVLKAATEMLSGFSVVIVVNTLLKTL